MSVIVVSVSQSSLLAAGFGRSKSLKWPWLFDKLQAQGYSKEKAAAIANSNLKFRKKGRLNVLTAKQSHNPAVMKRVAAADKMGKHMTGKQLTKGM